MGYFEGLTAEQARRRQRALERYAAWEASRRGLRLQEYGDAALRLEGVGWLWELLPAASRERPVDPEGVRRLHEAVAVLAPAE